MVGGASVGGALRVWGFSGWSFSVWHGVPEEAHGEGPGVVGGASVCGGWGYSVCWVRVELQHV